MRETPKLSHDEQDPRIDLLREVITETSITPSALGRKLRKPASVIKEWLAGNGFPDNESALQLKEMLARTQQPALSAPRAVRPSLDSKVHCGDGRVYLSSLPDESIDLIVSDIPYGIGLDDWDVLHDNTNSAYMGSSAAQQKAGNIFKKRRKPINGWSNADKSIAAEYYEWCRSWSADWLRVLRPGGSAFVFSGRRLAHRCASALEDEGFNLRDILAWERTQAAFRAQRLSVIFQKRGALSEANRWNGWRVGNLRPTFEPIIWCFKPYDVTIADNMLDHNVGAMNVDAFQRLTGSTDNILKFGFDAGERGHHEAQKPVNLLRTLIELTTIRGQVVLDPFAGSGSTAVAAKACGRKYITVERDPTMCDVIKKRLEEGPT
tara:strand:+ start:2269 stop:3402 length:1134 start_codon:yes stop_codon:yes gene_type:complete